jgi:hypothetical protein
MELALRQSCWVEILAKHFSQVLPAPPLPCYQAARLANQDFLIGEVRSFAWESEGVDHDAAADFIAIA